MIKKGFTFPKTTERLRQGPLSKYLDAYSVTQAGLGYEPLSIRQQLLVIADFSGWLEGKEIAVRKIGDDDVDRFLRLRQRQKRVRRGDPTALKRMLAMLREKGVVKREPAASNAPAKVTAEFQQYLLHERRLSPATLRHYVPVIEQFLSESFGDETTNVRLLCASDVTKFVVRQAHRLSPVRAGLVVTALRSFFRYLRHRGKVSIDLSGCVPTVSNWSLSTLPRFIPTNDVERILKCCDRKSSVGRRNYAILLLLARLGLRAGEVVGLTLDDIDWNAGQITIRGKGGRSVPLPGRCGCSSGRISAQRSPPFVSRRAFIRHRAPLIGFANASAISTLVMRAIKHAGVESAHKGAHVLRHSLATTLLRQGGSLDEIGELLRHKSPNTTAIYAKVDVTALHTLALPWPGCRR
ncbi:MAG: tyrosine-type recombinase/integrase [Bryobacteraceae bacterium]